MPQESCNAPDIRYLVGTPRGDAPLKINCPFHEDDTPSYAVYADGAKCFGCGAYETTAQFIARVGGDPSALPTAHRLRSQPAPAPDTPAEVGLRLRTWQRTLLEGARSPRQQWFLARGFWQSSISRFGFGHTGDRFSIPCGDSYQLRSDPLYCDEEEPRFLSHKGFPSQIVRPNPYGSTHVICEGPLDAYLLAQFGYDAITTSGGAGSLAPMLEQALSWRLRVVIATDLDEAGEEAATQLQLAFPNSRRVMWQEGKDITDFICSVPEARRGSWLARVLEGW